MTRTRNPDHHRPLCLLAPLLSVLLHACDESDLCDEFAAGSEDHELCLAADEPEVELRALTHDTPRPCKPPVIIKGLANHTDSPPSPCSSPKPTLKKLKLVDKE